MNHLDREKAIEVFIYVSRHSTNIYNILKIIYFADKEHLGNYGRFIYGDTYIAMENGPVPSFAYDIAKCIRGDGVYSIPEVKENDFLIKDQYHISPKRDAKQNCLSDTDIECLNNAIKTYGNMSFSRLRRISHEQADFKDIHTSLDGVMPIEVIAKHLPDAEALIEHIKNQ